MNNKQSLNDFIKTLPIQRHLNKLNKKHKNKTIIIYGAGSLAEMIFDNYDLSDLNIVAIADLKYLNNSISQFYDYKAISPNKIKDYMPDIILIMSYDYLKVSKHLKMNIPELSKCIREHILPRNIFHKVVCRILGL